MMKELIYIFPFLIVFSLLQESRKRVKLEKKEPLVESQLFIMELARELNKICQRSSILSHIWTSEDVWPPAVCRDFIVEWAAVLEKRVKPRLIQSVNQYEKPEKKDWRGHLLCMLEAGGEGDMGPHKRNTVWPGEAVLMVLDDLELQWKRGRLQNLLPAMELLILAEDVTKQWLVRKQRSQKIDAARYIPHSVWNWICDAAEEVKLDSDSANPDLIISSDEKRMRCGLEHRDVPRCQRRFNGWWCSAGQEGFTSGRHYWEVEVGQRDWRLGLAKVSAVRQGYRSLTTDSGYLTLRLERGLDLKALTVPATPLTRIPLPRKVGVYLDYEQGQLSFYDVEKRSHLYTFNDTFTEELFPVFGTVEVVNDLVIRPADVRQPCLCTGPCLWT
ncbi:E3 ubiquitin-protein ligase TRIM39 [Dissostichus eleginoides]|uniref:E3 ubiquitin-protein ligase TRIM39 n=1 Tax=Dissostichus eleginoides TaxID=100907 RepID=A0AAD9BDP2_DISEL|nr:E3 ubiquitin-protein ligase TRIM39 [Dissostichus eleginoides]